MDKTPYITIVATIISGTFILLHDRKKKELEKQAADISMCNGNPKRLERIPALQYTNIPDKITYKNIELLSSYNKLEIIDQIHNFELIELRELLCILIAEIIQLNSWDHILTSSFK